MLRSGGGADFAEGSGSQEHDIALADRTFRRLLTAQVGALSSTALALLAYDALFAANAAAFVFLTLLVFSLRSPSPRSSERERGVQE